MNKIVIAAITSLLALSACQTVYMPKAREVKKKPQSNGVIALPASYRPEDRQQADQLMKTNCAGANVVVSDEGEVVVGQKTQSTASSANRDDTRQDAGTLFGIPLTTGSAGGTDTHNDSTTTQVKEWQIVYNCETDKPKARR